MSSPCSPTRKKNRPSPHRRADTDGHQSAASRRTAPKPQRSATPPPAPRRWVADLGNTWLRFGEIRDAGVVLRLTLPTHEPERLRELGGLLGDGDRGGTCHAASVCPPANGPFEAELAARGIRTVFADPARHLLMPHSLRTPATTGADRLLAARAAWDRIGRVARETGRPLAGVAVLLAGTALVVDWVDTKGVFRGGYILPGPEMWLSSLARAAMLPKLVPDTEAAWNETVGPATRSAMRHGMTVGLRGAAREAVTAIRRQAGRVDLPVVIDGGWARELAPAFPHEAIFSPLLVLEGLRLWAGSPEGQRATS